jgi:hypothetical protein
MLLTQAMAASRPAAKNLLITSKSPKARDQRAFPGGIEHAAGAQFNSVCGEPFSVREK